MDEEPVEAIGPAEAEQSVKPWPVMDRSMVNHHGNVIQGDMHVHIRRGRFGPRWPGLVLLLLGLLLAGFGLVAWCSNLVQSLRRDEPLVLAEMLGPSLPSGVTVGVAQACAFVTGIVLMSICSSMRRTAPRTGLQIILLVLLIAAVVVLVVLALGGAPVSALLPDFSR